MYNLNEREILFLNEYSTLDMNNPELGSTALKIQRILEAMLVEFCSRYEKIASGVHLLLEQIGKDKEFISSIQKTSDKPNYRRDFHIFRQNAYEINTCGNSKKHHPFIDPTPKKLNSARESIDECLKWYFEFGIKKTVKEIESTDSIAMNALHEIFSPTLKKGEGKTVEPHKQLVEKDNQIKLPETTEEIKINPPISPKTNKHLLSIGLIIISVGLIVYFILTLNDKKQKTNSPTVIVPENPADSVSSPDTTKHKPSNNPPTNEKSTNNPPIVNETEVGKKEEKEFKPVESPEPNGTSKYILNEEFKNNEGSTEMAVLIINNNSINGAIGQKVANVFLKNKGYNNTTSLLSQQFVSDGIFERIFNGGKTDLSKHKFSEYADYFCLGKLNIHTEQSDVRPDMRKATISLEIKVVKTNNGGEIINFTIPPRFNNGIGFSNQEAIEVATNNIITYLKNY
jgi:hypothetical protein